MFSPAAKAGLVLVREGGGPLETLTVPDASKGEVSHRWPSALPDGRHVLFTIKKEGITSFDQGEIALLDLETRIVDDARPRRDRSPGTCPRDTSCSRAAARSWRWPSISAEERVTGPPVTVARAA